jgi:DNA-binding response OmpR family regulator
MPRILVVTDEAWVRNEVHAALSAPGIELTDHPDPETVASVATEGGVDVVVVDLQVGSMGGMAVTRALRASGPRDTAIPVILLLDRAADTFLAGRSGADAWVLKPFSANDLRVALNSVTVSEPT